MAANGCSSSAGPSTGSAPSSAPPHPGSAYSILGNSIFEGVGTADPARLHPHHQHDRLVISNPVRGCSG